MASTLSYDSMAGGAEPVSLSEAMQKGHSGSQAMSVLMLLAIWFPAAAFALMFWAIDLPYFAVAVAGIAMLLHGLLRPSVAFYILIFALYFDWALYAGFAASFGKFVGAFVALACLPRIVDAIRSRPWDPAAKWVLLLVGYAALLVPLFPGPKLGGLIQWLRMPLIYGMILMAAVIFDRPAKVRWLIYVIVVTSILMAFVWVFGDVGLEAMETEQRSTMTTDIMAQHATGNEMGRLMALGFFGALYLLLQFRSPMIRIGSVAALGVIGLGLVLTKGRVIYLSVALALIVALLLSKLPWSRRLLLVGLIVLFGAAGVVLIDLMGWTGEGIVARFMSIFDPSDPSGARARLSRFGYWSAYWDAAVRRAFVGYGFYGTREFTGTSIAHNDVITIMGDLGLVGLIAFFGLHVSLFRRLRGMRHRWLQFYVTTVWSFILFAGLTQTDFYTRHYGLSLALLIVLIRLDEQYREAEASEVAPEPQPAVHPPPRYALP